MLDMVVEHADAAVQEPESGEGPSDLIKLALALGCPPVKIPPPREDTDDVIRLYAIDLSRADPEMIRELGLDGSWKPVEETPEERARRLEEGLAAIAEYEAEYGAFTADEKAWARGIMASLGIDVDS